MQKPDGVCTSFLADTPPKQASSTVFDPLLVSDADAAEPHIWPKFYLTDAQPNNPSESCSGYVYQTGAGPEHGELSCSHGTFLHVAPYVAQSHSAINPPLASIHYISRDQPNAHELTNHIPHPSPAPGLRSPGAPGNLKKLRRWYGMVPVSPTGTTASFPRILRMGMT